MGATSKRSGPESLRCDGTRSAAETHRQGPGAAPKQLLVVPGALALATAHIGSPQRNASGLTGPSAEHQTSPAAEDCNSSLPPFLRRRSRHQTSTSDSACSVATREDDVKRSGERSKRDEEQRRGTVAEDFAVDEDDSDEDDDDEPLPIEADDDDVDLVLLSERELMAMADEMTGSTGLTQAEVVSLLREFEEKKKQAIAEKSRPKAFFTEAQPAKQKKPKRPAAPAQAVPFSLPKLTTEVAFLERDTHSDNGAAGALGQPAKGDPHVLGKGECLATETNDADRLQHLLDEFLAPQASSRGGGDPTFAAYLDGEPTSFLALRQQRAYDRHQAVTNYLAAKRKGVSLAPATAPSDEKFVQAYKAQLEKRLRRLEEKKALREQLKAEETQRRRERGLLSNIAIRGKIEQAEEAKKKEAAAMAERVALLREREEIWDL